MRILFTICGRAGSKGLRNKNIKLMKGVPLVYYTLAAIRLYMDAHPANEIMVVLNTDSTELIELVTNQRIIEKVECVDRRMELADDASPKVAVVQDTYFQCKKKACGFDVIVDLDITSPLRRVCDIEETIRQLTADPKCELAFSVVKARRNPYFNMVEEGEFYYKKVCESAYTSRQQAPDIYELNASIYAYRPSFLESDITRTILEYKCRVAVMPDFLVLDIDSEEDFEAMEMVAELFCKKDRALWEVMETAKGSKVTLAPEKKPEGDEDITDV